MSQAYTRTVDCHIRYQYSTCNRSVLALQVPDHGPVQESNMGSNFPIDFSLMFFAFLRKGDIYIVKFKSSTICGSAQLQITHQ